MSEEKKILNINCALLDATKASEETLAAYDKIDIDCATALLTEESRVRLARYPVSIDAAKVKILPSGCCLQTVSGGMCLSGSQEAAPGTALHVSGGLTVLPGAEKALRSYAAVIVSGGMLCPDSMHADAAQIAVSGSVRYYPHDAILIDRPLTIDPFFILQAEAQRLYYVTKDVDITEEGLPLASLLEKGVRLQAKRAVVRAGYLADAAKLLAGDMRPTVVPDDCAYVREEAPLDVLTARYGKRLFLDCKLSLSADDSEALSSLEYLEVQGEVTLPQALLEPFCQKCKKFGKLNVIREGKNAACICDIPEVIVTRQLLESCPQELRISDCAQVRVDPDIPPELLGRIRLIEDCGDIRCSREQQAILQLVCSDIGTFSDSAAFDGETPKTEKGYLVTKVNCASYVL